MSDAVSNTSPLYYLYRIGVFGWLPQLFTTTWAPNAVGVLLEGKKQGLAERIAPLVDRLEEAGMWISGDIRQRILALAGEEGG